MLTRKILYDPDMVLKQIRYKLIVRGRIRKKTEIVGTNFWCSRLLHVNLIPYHKKKVLRLERVQRKLLMSRKYFCTRNNCV